MPGWLPGLFSRAGGVEMIDAIGNAANLSLVAAEPHALFQSLAAAALEQKRLLSARKIWHRPIRAKSSNLPREPPLTFRRAVDAPVRTTNLAHPKLALILTRAKPCHPTNLTRKASPRRAVVILRELIALALHLPANAFQPRLRSGPAVSWNDDAIATGSMVYDLTAIKGVVLGRAGWTVSCVEG